MIFQDLPDSSVGPPAGGAGPQGGPDHRGAAGRRASARDSGSSTGPRSGRWTGSTTRSSREPIVPELAATGRTADGPGFGIAPGLWLRHRLPGWLRYRVGPAGNHLARRVSAPRDGPARPPGRAGVPARRLAARRGSPSGPDAPAGRLRPTSRRSPRGSARSAGWPCSGCSSRA